MDLEKELALAVDCEDSRVKEAMLYSLCAPGKRVRAKLVLNTLKGFGIDENEGIPYACAIEMVHAYSLIHDDLPAMDNDDLRRGRPTCHKAFDEATAILAGDGLLTEAFHLIGKQENDHVARVCSMLLAKAAGASGMILGQQLDIEAENKNIDFDGLKKIHRNKTGCLLAVPMMMGCVIANKDEFVDEFENIGIELGLAFQVQDDVLDIISSIEVLGKSNSDVENHKQTSVTLLGLDKAKELMETLYDDVSNRLKAIQGFNSEYIEEMIIQLKVRNK